ncbi:MAG TPA: cytochrome c oxidase assembly protein [Euzebyales bacterium]
MDQISWWCSGTLGQPWTWEYRPLLGVWLLAAALGGAYAFAMWHHHTSTAPRSPSSGHYAVRFTAALVLLVVSSEWPLGPLGAGYLASIAALRMLLLTFGVAPLLLVGTPPWMLRALLGVDGGSGDRPRRRLRLAQVLTFPWVAFLLFNVTLIVTQLPPVVDTMKITQLGSFGLDIAWLAASIIVWVPIVRPVPELGGLGDPMRLLYLFGLSVLPTVPASFLTFSRFPLYRLYELAPRVFDPIDAVLDQQIAGLSLKVGGGILLWTAMTVLFFRWAAQEQPDAVQSVSWARFERDLERHDLRSHRERPPS